MHINCLELLAAYLAFKCFFSFHYAGSFFLLFSLIQKEEHQCLVKDGQHISSCLRRQDGRAGAPGSEQYKQGVLTVVSGEGQLCSSPAFSGQTELHNRCRI